MPWRGVVAEEDLHAGVDSWHVKGHCERVEIPGLWPSSVENLVNKTEPRRRIDHSHRPRTSAMCASGTLARIVAVPSGAEDQRAVSPLVPPVVGLGPNSSYAYQCVAAPVGLSCLELAAGVSVALSAEIRLSVDRARAMSSRISTRFAPQWLRGLR